MHIGLYTPAWPVNEFSNGIVTYVHSLRIELLRLGHQVSIFATVVGKTNTDSQVYKIRPSRAFNIARKIGSIFWKHSYAFNWGKAIGATVREVHRTNPIDVLEMEESFGWFADVSRAVAIPIVVKLHGPAFLDLVEEERQTRFARAKIAAEGRALRRASVVISPSANTLRQTEAFYECKLPSAEVVANPLSIDSDLKIWNPASCDRKAILFVGRFDKRKGGDTVLLAFRKLLAEDPALKLLFVGPDVGLTTPTGARIHFDEFCGSLLDSRQKRQISYLGKIPRTEIFDLRAVAMVTLVASRWDNQPNTALEAMLQGCPVVAIDSGGVDEIIDDRKTGLLARNNDIDDFCAKIKAMLESPDEAGNMGLRARSAIAERHSPNKLAMATIRVYGHAITLAQAAG